MSIINSSGPFSFKKPRGTNPALFSLPEYQPKDELIDPLLTSDQVARGDLHNLYISPVKSFRNTAYVIGWETERVLADHANQHIINGTFGTGPEGIQKLIEHQTLMYNGLLAGMSFLESHKYALRNGPSPVSELDRGIPFTQFDTQVGTS